MDNLIIIGTSTNARHALSFIRCYNLYNVIGFAVNKQYLSEDSFMGLPVYPLEELKERIDVPFKVFVSLLWNRLNADRRHLFEYCKSNNFDFANLISPHAIIRPGSVIGKNCWVHDFALLQNDTIIGDNVPIMAYALIGTNTHIGSHTFVGTRSLIAGGCIIGEQCFIGIGATIFDGTTIGDKCIIGGCAIVKRNMPSFSKFSTITTECNIKQYSENDIESKLIFNKNIR